MFYYELYSWDDCMTFAHEKRFSNDEFTAMCEEVDTNLFDQYEPKVVEQYLVGNHGFRRVRAVADYFINNK